VSGGGRRCRDASTHLPPTTLHTPSVSSSTKLSSEGPPTAPSRVRTRGGFCQQHRRGKAA